MQTLSNNAKVLLAAIKDKSMWEGDTINVLFPKPPYVGTLDAGYTEDEKIRIQSIYWQWDINLYGNAAIRPVNGESVQFEMNVPKCYADVTRDAIKELLSAGLITSHNGGYNTYSYHYAGI